MTVLILFGIQNDLGEQAFGVSELSIISGFQTRKRMAVQHQGQMMESTTLNIRIPVRIT